MSGKELKDILEREGIVLSELARLLGFTTISERFISLLEKKDEQMDRLLTMLEKAQ